MKTAAIYYVEDDPDIGENVKAYLNMRQMEVEVFPTLEEARKALQKNIPSLLLIDQQLPDGRGEELCRQVRRRLGDRLPILYLTVEGETKEVVRGFADGADDYVIKPFALEILYSRIRALLRRSGKRKETRLLCDQILLDTEKMAVFCGQEEVYLSPAEYQLLLALMENKGKTVTRNRLLERVWDSNGNFVNDNTLTVTMKRLREKLHHPSCLKTIRSFGYRMEDSP